MKKTIFALALLPMLLMSCGDNGEKFNEITYEQFAEKASAAETEYASKASEDGTPYYKEIAIKGSNAMTLGSQTKNMEYDVTFTWKNEDGFSGYSTEETDPEKSAQAISKILVTAEGFASTLEEYKATTENLKFYLGEKQSLKVTGSYVATMNIGMEIKLNTNVNYLFNSLGRVVTADNSADGSVKQAGQEYAYTAKENWSATYVINESADASK